MKKLILGFDMKKLLLASALLASPAFGIEINHNDVIQDLNEFSAETGVEFDNQLDICLWETFSKKWDCERFSEHTTSAFVTSMYVQKVDKKDPKSEGGRTGLKTVLKTVKDLAGAGVKVTIDSIKINVDGSYEIIGINFHAGIGSGTPVPGQNDDGQQVHRN